MLTTESVRVRHFPRVICKDADDDLWNVYEVRKLGDMYLWSLVDWEGRSEIIPSIEVLAKKWNPLVQFPYKVWDGASIKTRELAMLVALKEGART